MEQPCDRDKTAIRSGDERHAVVLLVDDEPNILTALKRTFRRADCDVLTAGSGAEGLEVLAANPVDVVISDMRMPNMGGVEFLARVAMDWPETVRMLLTGYADLDTTIAAINRGSIFQYLSKPWEDHDLLLAVRNATEKKRLEEERERLRALTEKQNEQLKVLNVGLEQRVRERTRELQQAMDHLRDAHAALKKNYVASVKVFAGIAELREPALAGHSKRVAEHARRIGQRMGLRDEAAQNLLFAALLHDIGKIGLPDGLLAKPFNALGVPDRNKLTKHAILGEALLMQLDPLQDAAHLIRHHHERYDGQGYPDGLSGESIPFGARILAVANDYDALQIGTISTQRLMPLEARQFLRENRGKRYDPVVVDAFINELDGGAPRPIEAVGVIVHASDLEVGMVLARDLVTRDKLLLLSESFVFDEKLIHRVQKFEQALGEKLNICIHGRNREAGVEEA